jgi:anhydro-N-acetylmuramic acid kinase
VHVIGFHGHTIRHLPDEGLTWQIGNASLLSERTGIRVVSDFRRRDLAAHGQGAPLAALFHAAALPHNLEKPVAVVNIGGVANVTWIGSDGVILAGDTGPGCGLLDQWCQSQTGQPLDLDGQLARQGRVDQESVQRSLDQPFFKRPFPKSADRFDFGQIDLSHLSPADGAATLCALTAATIAAAMEEMPATPKRTFVTGGGGQNPFLMQQLHAQLPGVALISEIGWRPDSLEAECFAWLAVRSLRGLPLSQPSTTGVRRPTGGGLATHYDRLLHPL